MIDRACGSACADTVVLMAALLCLLSAGGGATSCDAWGHSAFPSTLLTQEDAGPPQPLQGATGAPQSGPETSLVASPALQAGMGVGRGATKGGLGKGRGAGLGM